MKAVWNGMVIADSDDTVVVEGNHYFPMYSVDEGLLRPSQTHTTCGWKGQASYFTIEANGRTNEDAAWFYPEPLPGAEAVAGRVAFWKGVDVRD